MGSTLTLNYNAATLDYQMGTIKILMWDVIYIMEYLECLMGRTELPLQRMKELVANILPEKRRDTQHWISMMVSILHTHEHV